MIKKLQLGLFMYISIKFFIRIWNHEMNIANIHAFGIASRDIPKVRCLSHSTSDFLTLVSNLSLFLSSHILKPYLNRPDT